MRLNQFFSTRSFLLPVQGWQLTAAHTRVVVCGFPRGALRRALLSSAPLSWSWVSKDTFSSGPSSGDNRGVSCASLAGWLWGWRWAAPGALSRVSTSNWPHRTYKEFTTHLLGCLPGDLNCHFKTWALALNLSPTTYWLEISYICPCWV